MALTAETEIAKDWQMNLEAWEATISQIVDEASQKPRESGRQKILIAWRAKLEKEPTFLEPYQIDEIVKEVRKRLADVNR
jgi:hypothetical protein